MRTAVSALLLAAVSTLTHSQLPSIVKTARFVTLQRWEGRIDEMLARYGQTHQAPASWRADDPHWEQAKAKLLARFGKAIDELASAPDAEALVAKGFASMSDKDADAAAARVTPEFLNYSDLVIVSVEVMSDRKITSPVDPAVLEVQKTWGGAKPPRDYDPGKDPSSRKLMDARSSAVRFLSTGLDGQLKLFVFDRQEAIDREIAAALAACVKAKHK